jgi:hypothetical protein
LNTFYHKQYSLNADMADNDNDNFETTTDNTALISSAGNKKRSRVQFSCTACRYRK